MSRDYSTLLQALETDEVAIHHLLTGKSPNELIAVLAEMFEVAMKRLNDAAAKKYLGWLFHAISDLVLEPVKEPDWRVFQQAELNARCMRANRAIMLWPKPLPSMAGPVLVETKKALLTEIAEWWAMTRDESEADHVFEFMTELDFRRFDKERTIFHDVVRAVTDNSFPLPRLARHLVYLHDSKKSVRETFHMETARILAVAFARNSCLSLDNMTRFTRQLQVVEHLWEALPPAFELVTKFAEEVAALDADAQTLRGVLGQRGTFDQRIEGYEDIPGTLTISYPSPGRIVAGLTIPRRRYADFYPKPFDANEGHEWFEAAKRNVRRWQETHRHTVWLMLRVTEGSGYGQKEVFQRDQTLEPEQIPA